MKFAASLFLCVMIFVLSSQGISDRASAAARHIGSVHCGTERWAAKSLSDGSAIDFTSPASTTVADLRGLGRPNGVDNKSGPRVPEETRVYTIHALMQEYKIEADHDIHIVISDFGGSPRATMIAEVPDPQCDGVSGDGMTKQFASVRSALQDRFGTATGVMNQVNAEVTLTGVLFFDFLHGQTGVTPNGAELHPVVAMSFGSAQPATGATTPPAGQPAEFDTEAAAQAHCPNDVVVWLNTRSGMYHFKGHRYYGTTTRGAYVCKAEADQAGDQEGY